MSGQVAAVDKDNPDDPTDSSSMSSATQPGINTASTDSDLRSTVQEGRCPPVSSTSIATPGGARPAGGSSELCTRYSHCEMVMTRTIGSLSCIVMLTRRHLFFCLDFRI